MRKTPVPSASRRGRSLTFFKKASEYVIAGVLIASVVLTVISELFFTLYRDAYGFTNELGHLLKLASFYLIYWAVIQTGIQKPYTVLLRDLKKSIYRVEDNGIGIAREHQARVFEIFHRLNVDSQVEGEGLDLLSQSIILEGLRGNNDVAGMVGVRLWIDGRFSKLWDGRWPRRGCRVVVRPVRPVPSAHPTSF